MLYKEKLLSQPYDKDEDELPKRSENSSRVDKKQILINFLAPALLLVVNVLYFISLGS
jgi:hypothetical protein